MSVPIGKMLPPPPLVFPTVDRGLTARIKNAVPANYTPYILGAVGVFVLGIVLKKAL